MRRRDGWLGACLLVLGAGWVAACAEPAPEAVPTRPRAPDDVNQPPGDDGQAIMVPSGAFMMGCNSAVVQLCDTDETPYHSVVLSSFEIDRLEVSQSAYARCIEAGACDEPADTSRWEPIELAALPVVGVTWAQADGFCTWEGRRLPSEAEWERAARGSDGRVWPWGSETPDCTRANVGGCGGAPRAVGSFPMGASPVGALDMAGNAVEWVADWYDDDAYRAYAAGTRDPRGPASGVARVLRGGGYLSDGRSVRASYRGLYAPEGALPTVGFRCARSVETMPGVD